MRVPDLFGFRRAIASFSTNRSSRETGPVVVVPTRSAAKQLPSVLALTRDQLYDHLHARLPNLPRRLTALECEVLIQAAARAAAHGTEVPFQLRPGILAEMLRFYDDLRRQSQKVDRFASLVGESLGSEDLERGIERMRKLTAFLADAFRGYERRVRGSDACDEHLLREWLVAQPAPDPVRHVVVTVADWIADSDGLYVADFDLLARLPGLESLDIVATENLL
jgi:hypothetical protein